MDISFIWVNFHSGAILRRSLLSVVSAVENTDLLAEYIIVNNDGAEEGIIESLKGDFSQIKIIHSGKNIGFGRASMLGSGIAQGKLLFFINPDTIFLSGNFKGLLQAFEYRPNAMYGMRLERAGGVSEPWSAGAFPSLQRLVGTNLGFDPNRSPWQARMIQETDWVSGAALAIRRDVFESAGGFDERFFLYFEDVDLAYRVKQRGGWVGVYPFLRFLHMGGESHASRAAQKRFYYESQLRYFKKWRPWYESAIVLGIHKVFRYQ